ncbi:MAG: hypothetical protein RJA34_1700, partial [Pseudomonadota bacterium]
MCSKQRGSTYVPDPKSTEDQSPLHYRQADKNATEPLVIH